MNFQEIFTMQKALDQAIEQTHQVQPKAIIKQKILALIVEISEFANEYAPFKYWKKNKVINQKKLVEEFVDGIHFLVSLGLYLKINPVIEPQIIHADKSKQLLATIEVVLQLNHDFTGPNLTKAFAVYLGNAQLLNISNQAIINSYILKNKINFDRIENNY